MGGFKLKPVEIPEAPKVPEGFKSNISLRGPERPILQPVPEGVDATGIFIPTAEPTMTITPDRNLNSSVGVKYVDIGALMAKDGTGRTYMAHQMLQSPVTPRTLATLAMTFGVLGLVMHPGMVSWMMEHVGSFLGYMGLPFLGMVMGGGGRKGNSEGGIEKFSDLSQYREARDLLEKNEGAPKTVSFVGEDPQEIDPITKKPKEVNSILTIGKVIHQGRETKLEVWTSPFRIVENSFWGGNTHRFGESGDGFEISVDMWPHPGFTLLINTNDRNTAEQIHQQIVDEITRTGSAQAALDSLRRSPWDPQLFKETPLSPLEVNLNSPSYRDNYLNAMTLAEKIKETWDPTTFDLLVDEALKGNSAVIVAVGDLYKAGYPPAFSLLKELAISGKGESNLVAIEGLFFLAHLDGDLPAREFLKGMDVSRVVQMADKNNTYAERVLLLLFSMKNQKALEALIQSVDRWSSWPSVKLAELIHQGDASAFWALLALARNGSSTAKRMLKQLARKEPQ